MSNSYTFFFHGTSVFSNWNMVEFELYGQRFNCGEQAMMWIKAMLFGDTEVAQEIMKAKTPKDQKALGQKVTPFNQVFWDAVCTRLMYMVVSSKFEQNESYQKELRKTGTTLMVEAASRDLIWGIGLNEHNARNTPEAQWPGQNLLGKMLTKYREDHVKGKVKYMTLDQLTEVGVRAVQERAAQEGR